jgi:DNA-binding SARP family transcriptional activator/class 3 adenylate cyclase
MREPWRIFVLGGLRAECEQHTISRFRTQKTGWLLAYLACSLKRIHSRDELAARFWPDADPEVGRTNLRTALSSLRRQLEPPGTPAGAVLVADRVSVCLNPEAVTIDAALFEEALQSAEVLPTDFRRIDALTRAVEQYGGELLPGCYEEWVLTERERLAQAHLGALRQLTRLLENTGDLPRALDVARRAVAADPFDEESHQDLMRLLAANGLPAAAVRQFQGLERLLREELAERPSTATRALVERIQREPASLRLFPSRLPAPGSRLPARTARAGSWEGHRRAQRGGPAGSSIALPAGTVTFLLTDIERSTAQWERTGEAFAQVLDRHDALLRAAFQRHGGHEIKALGDGFLVTFSRVEEALACAIAGQRALAAEGWPEPAGPVRVRMALHTGDVEPEQSDYHSLVLHRAARMLAAAHGGQIRCSEATAALLRRDLGPGVRLVDLGLHRLRDVPLPERLYMAQYPDMAPRRFPSLRTEPVHTPRLPLQFTRFFGREAEIAALGELLRAPETRLVTLTGLGGSGKTRLAIEVAGRLGETFGGAIYFASLADLSEACQIPEALLEALGLERLCGVEPLAQIARFLEGERALLVLDNLEHLVEGGGPFVYELLVHAPRLSCLVTSRQKLEIAPEREFVVLPLPVPKSAPGVALTPERLMEVASVQLFADRARAARPDFAVTPGNVAAVAALCVRLEGIPLALELAAARASLLTPAQTLAQLGASLDVLVSRRRDIAPRHRTLRAAILWSFEQLSPELQRFFAARMQLPVIS